MTINFEVKKDGLRQTQDGIWKLTLTVLPEDMPVELMQAPMGTPYGLAMAPIDYDNPQPPEKTEGEKLRTRAVMLCEDYDFVDFCNLKLTAPYELLALNIDQRARIAKNYIYQYCGIESRAELAINAEAQKRFKELDRQYKEWLNPIDKQYKDNLERL